MKTVCIFGDSIARGIGASDPKLSWAGILEEKYPFVRFCNHGGPGDPTDRGLARLDAVLSDRPQITVIQFGMNDHCLDENGQHRVAPEQYEKNLCEIADRLTAAGSALIFVTNHLVIEGNSESYYYSRHPKEQYAGFGGVNSLLEKYNDIVRKTAEKYVSPLVDMEKISRNYDAYEFLRTLRNSDTDDGVHPSDAGHAVYAEKIGTALSELLS